jgi:PEP-CTERM motif-containing protein
LIIRFEQTPDVLFTDTVPANVFFDAWSFTGRNRFAGNSQEEMGQFMFVDDGTNLWHMSFYNHGNDDYDGIYMGGDPDGPVLGVTATKVWAETVGAGAPGSPTNKPFDGFHEYSLVDADGAGGAPPTVQLNGENLELLVPIISAPSMFPAGTVGWGSINANEVGYFQTTHMVFDGNPDAEPPAGLPGDFNADQAVNAADFIVWRKNLGAADETALNGNGNGTNGVDEGDYSLWRTNFGRTPAGSSASALGAVPEPSSLALVAVGVIVSLAFRRPASH